MIENLVSRVGHALWRVLEEAAEDSGLQAHHYPLLEEAIARTLSPHVKFPGAAGELVPVDRVLCWMLWGEWGKFHECSLEEGEEPRDEKLAHAIVEAVEGLLMRLRLRRAFPPAQHEALTKAVLEALGSDGRTEKTPPARAAA